MDNDLLIRAQQLLAERGIEMTPEQLSRHFYGCQGEQQGDEHLRSFVEVETTYQGR